MRVAESHQSNLETIQSQAVKDNKPLLNEIFINEEANLRTVGTTIIRRLHEDFYQVLDIFHPNRLPLKTYHVSMVITLTYVGIN